MNAPCGQLLSISGSVARATLCAPAALGEVVNVGDERLLGEVVVLEGDVATVQVYEETSGLAPGDPLFGTGEPLSVELGPGLLGSTFDGIQRPLEALALSQGHFISRGTQVPALDRERRWEFTPALKAGQTITGGAIVGTLPETPAVQHRVLVPPAVHGTVTFIADKGAYRVSDVVARVRGEDGVEHAVTLMQRWRVREPRPLQKRLALSTPMITGQRVLDTFFPLPRGSTAGMPGGFGTGKTVLQHQLCKWAAADVIVYVGCGERGNEMTHMLKELPELLDPRTGRPLAERTVLIANTSNMPVSAREASLYTGVTLAEYYRDMGYHVALMADSTSRWAEALREISGRLGEMPAEEGYPPYLSSRLASYYERAGRGVALCGAEGSLTLISAISPPGGDFTEPVTRHTQSLARVFWTLDRDLASARVYPAVSIELSYSEVPEALEDWWHAEVAPDWGRLRTDALALLGEAERLEGTARLIGAESLPERQRFILFLARLFQDGFLQQSALDAKDASCAPARQVALLRLLLQLRDRGLRALSQNVAVEKLTALKVAQELARARSRYSDAELPALLELGKRIDAEVEALEADQRAQEAA